MSEIIWDVYGNSHRKLTIERIGYKGAFVVWKYEEISVPDWAHPRKSDDTKDSVQPGTCDYTTHSPCDRIIACRVWLQAGPPKPYSNIPNGSAPMYVLDVVYFSAFFECPCFIDDWSVSFGEYDENAEDDKLYDLIAFKLTDMTDEQKLSKGYPADSHAINPNSDDKALNPMTPHDTPDDMLTIQEAATYVHKTEKTIRNWINTTDGNKPMLEGVTGTGRLTRIPRRSLTPYIKKDASKKPVKRN